MVRQMTSFVPDSGFFRRDLFGEQQGLGLLDDVAGGRLAAVLALRQIEAEDVVGGEVVGVDVVVAPVPRDVARFRAAVDPSRVIVSAQDDDLLLPVVTGAGRVLHRELGSQHRTEKIVRMLVLLTSIINTNLS